MKMKNHYFFILVLAITLLSCQNNQESQVREVAQQYLEAVGNYKFEEGRAFVTDSSQNFIDRMTNVVKMMTQEDLEKNLPVTVTIKQFSINQDTALVNFDTQSPLYTHNGNIYLVRQTNNIWLVDLPKSFSLQMARKK